jgi:uncharacterized protein (TIGR02058 family)
VVCLFFGDWRGPIQSALGQNSPTGKLLPIFLRFERLGAKLALEIDFPPHSNESKNLMARVRCITEMGMGVDVHGKDSTKAARRAVSDAIRHSSLGFFRMLGKTANDMFVDVTIAVPDPASVDTAAVAKELPYGTVVVNAVKGGLEIPAESGGDSIIIANAAVIVSFDDGKTG